MEPQTNNETSSKTSDGASVNNIAFLLTKRNLDGNSLRHRGFLLIFLLSNRILTCSLNRNF